MQQVKAVKAGAVRRTCPVCFEYADVIITSSNGWEKWRCLTCGGETQYCISGRPQ